MPTRSISFVHVLFALLLLFAQQRALLHALDHDFERIHAPKDLTKHLDAPCTQCVAVAHLDHVAGVAGVSLASASYAPVRGERYDRAIGRSTPSAPYRSRAPPAFF